MKFSESDIPEESVTGSPADDTAAETEVTGINENVTAETDESPKTEAVTTAEIAPEENPEGEGAENKEDPKKKPKKEKKPLTVSLFIAVVAMIMSALLACQITFIAVKQKYDAKLATVQKELFASQKLNRLDQLYRTYYINDIDDDELLDGLIAGYILGAGDKYGNYMTAEEYTAYINALNSQIDGIGVSVIWNTDHSAIEILLVYEGSPAEEAGVLSGDLIVGVDGKSVAELGYDMSVAAIRGERGTEVTIKILRGESYAEELELNVKRAPIDVKTVKYKNYDNIGVITISNFYSDTPDGVKTAVEALQAAGCDRIIFDMRNNSGGLLTSVVKTLDYLLPEGVVVRTIDSSGKEVDYSSDANCISMPMTVIVNGGTASAAELFTSALMDFDYATVIGTQTYGKGTVTAPYQLGDGSIVYISMELYYPPKSDNFEGVGITPDEVLELSDEAKKINFYKLTLETDNQLQRAIEIIKNK